MAVNLLRATTILWYDCWHDAARCCLIPSTILAAFIRLQQAYLWYRAEQGRRKNETNVSENDTAYLHVSECCFMLCTLSKNYRVLSWQPFGEAAPPSGGRGARGSLPEVDLPSPYLVSGGLVLRGGWRAAVAVVVVYVSREWACMRRRRMLMLVLLGCTGCRARDAGWVAPWGLKSLSWLFFLWPTNVAIVVRVQRTMRNSNQSE